MNTNCEQCLGDHEARLKGVKTGYEAENDRLREWCKKLVEIDPRLSWDNGLQTYYKCQLCKVVVTVSDDGVSDNDIGHTTACPHHPDNLEFINGNG